MDQPPPTSPLHLSTIWSCLSLHPRSILSNKSLRQTLVRSLENGSAHSISRHGVLLMVDVAGYSSLLSGLSALGKLSSELITNSMGEYIDKVITLITTFKGDIIKFLGDAILVCFSPIPGESEADTVGRAVYCCLYIALNLTSFRMEIDKTTAQYTTVQQRQKTQLVNKTLTTSPASLGPLPKSTSNLNLTSMPPIASSSNLNISPLPPITAASAPAAHPVANSIALSVHLAVTSGTLTHVICGHPEKRLDYVVHSEECIKDLGPLLDGTKKGEIGLSESVVGHLRGRLGALEKMSGGLEVGSGGYFLRSREGIEMAMELLGEWRPGVDSNAVSQDMLNHPLGPQMDGPIPQIVQEEEKEDTNVEEDETGTAAVGGIESYKLARSFVNEALLFKIDSERQQLDYETTRAMSRAGSMRKGSKAIGDGVAFNFELRRATLRDVGNPSLLKKVMTVKGEFRVVTVVFVKLLSRFTAQRAQAAMSGFTRILRKWEGVLQQYAVDDKGQTFLACFGLPPYTHEKDALYALKAALEFDSFAKATPAVGDAVNVAARLLGIDSSSSASSVKCDSQTYKLTKEDFNHVFLGAQLLKGKSEPVDVWCVQGKEEAGGAGAYAMNMGTAIFGYKREREMLADAVRQWTNDDNPSKIVVMGKSGLGKSKILEEVTRQVTDLGFSYCLTQGSEIKQHTPLSSLQTLAMFILKRFSQPSTIIHVTSDSRTSDRRLSLGGASTHYTGALFQRHVKMAASHISQSTLNSDIHTYASRGNSVGTSTRLLPDGQIHKTMLMRFLEDMQERQELAPLLGDILPISAIENTLYTKDMDAATRKVELTGLMVRLINKTLEMERYAIIFDDTQWLDRISRDVISAIIQKCPKAMIVFFTRPVDEKAAATFSNILDSPSLKTISINGLQESDMKELLISKFSGLGVQQISSTTSSVIYDTCGSSPLLVDVLAESIKADFNAIFLIDRTGTLIFRGDDAIERVRSLNTLSSSVMLQYDRLSPQFQTILRKSSILGQYFDLNDLAQIMGDGSSGEEIQEAIRSQDIYCYLVKQESDYGGLPYMFRHIQLMSALYELQPYSERVKSHLCAAEYFESLLASNRDSLTPIVAYHYQKTDKIEKQILYVEQIAKQNFDKGHRECVPNFEALLHLLSLNPSLEIDDYRKAEWMAKLAWSRNMLTFMTEKEMELATNALALLGKPWPKTIEEGKKTMVKDVVKLFKLWRQTKGGLRPQKQFWGKQSSDSLNKEALKTAQIEHICYMTLFRLGAYVDVLPKAFFGLVMLRMCSSILPFAYLEKEKSKWAYVLLVVSLGLSWTAHGVSKLLFNQAQAVEQHMSENERQAVCGVYHLKTYGLFQYGRLRESVMSAHDFIRYHETRGDLSQVSMGYDVLMVSSIWRGELQSHESSILELVRQRVMYKWPLIHGLFLRRMLVADIEDARERYNQLMESMTQASLRHPFYEAIKIVPMVWLSFNDGDYASALNNFESACKVLCQLNKFNLSCFTAILFFPQLSLMLMTACDNSNPRKRHLWSHEDQQRLLGSIEHMIPCFELASKKHKLQLFLHPLVLMSSCKLILLRNPRKATKQVRDLLKSKKRQELLNEVILAKGSLCAFMALYSECEKEQADYFAEAQRIFEACGTIGAVNPTTDQLEILPQKPFPPSIAFTPDQRILIGHEAVAAAASEKDVLFVENVKWYMDTNNDDDGLFERLKEMGVRDDNESIVDTKERLYSIFMKRLVSMGEKHWKKDVTVLFVTVPRFWEWRHQQGRSVEIAASMARLHLGGVIYEDVAVATAFGVSKARYPKTVLVYNQSPTSFEASILKNNGILNLLSFTKGSPIASPDDLLTTINKAYLKPTNIDEIYYSSAINTSNLPTLLKTRAKPFDAETLSKGAALYAEHTRQSDFQEFRCLQNFMPQSIGVETSDGFFAPVLVKGSEIPQWKVRVFRKERGERMRVLSGDDPVAGRNTVLGEIDLSDFELGEEVHVAGQITERNPPQIGVYGSSSGRVRWLDLKFDVRYNRDFEEGVEGERRRKLVSYYWPDCCTVGYSGCVVEKGWTGAVYGIGV
ncbi:hypothetical protein HDV05_007934 [Chytridiales sp. JEL 0842]|nr:hypothetical protein HDV05_007934 [Chytridiales sp. JEL 0842]